MDRDDPHYLQALEKETQILEKRVEACKSRIMMVTCFDINVWLHATTLLHFVHPFFVSQLVPFCFAIECLSIERFWCFLVYKRRITICHATNLKYNWVLWHHSIVWCLLVDELTSKPCKTWEPYWSQNHFIRKRQYVWLSSVTPFYDSHLWLFLTCDSLSYNIELHTNSWKDSWYTTSICSDDLPDRSWIKWLFLWYIYVPPVTCGRMCAQSFSDMFMM